MNCKNLLILFLLLLILSCKNRSFSAKAINSSTAPFINIKDSSIQLKLHPADNTSIYYTIQLKTNMSEEINDKKRESESNIDIGIQYKIKKDTGNNYLFSLRYDQFKLHVKSDSVDKEIDASTAASSQDLSDRIFSIFNNALISGIVSPKGDVIAIHGIKELENKLDTIVKNAPQASAIKNTFDKGFLQSDFFKSNIEQSFKAYPARPLKLGDAWEHDDTLRSELQLPVKTVYTLESVNDNGMAAISVSSEIETDNQSLSIQGYDVTASINATQDGEINVDIASGLIKSGNNELKLKGTLEVMGRNVPIEFKIKTSIIGENK